MTLHPADPLSASAPAAAADLFAVAEAVPDAVVAADAGGSITMWTGGAQAMFGWTADEAVGRPVTDLLPERYRDVHRADFADAAAGGEPVLIGRHTVELEGLRKDGTELPLEVSLGAGEHAGAPLYVGVVRDITARRVAEEQQRQDQERAAAELERSNAELTQFASIASHDLNEPLRIVDGYLRLLSSRYDGKLDEQADEFIGFAVDAVARMRGLIDALLRYARVGTGEPPRESVDSTLLVHEALAAIGLTVSERFADVHLGELPTIHADPTLMRQVFQNLIANAVKFADADAPVVKVSAERGLDGWCFSVADNGPGLHEGDRERVFEMFGRGRAVGRGERGTGIGLAICKRAIERHGGRIWVQDGPGGGTDMRFTLPNPRKAS